MQLRSGASFAPYDLKPTFRHLARLGNPIPTPVNVEPLVQAAAASEDLHFEEGGDDSEGLGVSPRPLTPPTDLDSEDEAAALCPSSDVQPAAKKRPDGAKMRRSKKRIRLASSGHRPHTYTANPSVVAHRAEELKPLRAPADARELPASGSGSWVGQRKEGAKKKPWTVPELVGNNFTFIEWDGWWARCFFSMNFTDSLL